MPGPTPQSENVAKIARYIERCGPTTNSALRQVFGFGARKLNHLLDRLDSTRFQSERAGNDVRWRCVR